MAQKLSKILEILDDGRWHETDDLKQTMGLNGCEIREITEFLGKYDFAEVDDLKERVRINKHFKRISAQMV